TSLLKILEKNEIGRPATYANIMETGYTAAMEAELDNIAEGTADYLTVVRDYDLALDSQLADFIRSSIEEGSIVPCPQCENGKLRRINGQKGPFWGCSNYKEGCNYIAPDENGKPGKPKPKSTAYPCPQCGEDHLQRRVAKKGKGKYWWGCDRYPGCDYTAFDDKGKPKTKKA
ncbi:topoisomerase DNA-binding C4 zinc finger domain-containing protein, partial [uncultured Cardiobacterium sp.]|uniref:topoisomerase DNA-binding C4 zinc finger domain-containing protein n=1 Tax=uncultured Cardiobacterium sp. TaxID=417619 RepID=UPI00261E7582